MEGKQIYVAIDGNDEAIGTLEQPFASLHRAITEIRQLHQSQPKIWYNHSLSVTAFILFVSH